MLNKIYIITGYIILIFLFQSCDNDWKNFDIPGCTDSSASNFDLNANIDNGSCQEEFEPIIIYNVDASSYNDWVYFSFELGAIINIINPEISLEWDIAFKRNHMITNGGLSGSGSGCAIIDENQSWTNDSFSSSDEIPIYDCQVDKIIEGDNLPPDFYGCYNPYSGSHLFQDCVKNPALDQWGSFDTTYKFILDENNQFFVRDAIGNNYAFWPSAFEDANGEKGQISMKFRLLY